MAAAKGNAFVTTSQSLTPIPSGSGDEKFKDQPYLQCLEQLQDSFPPLQSFLKKVGNVDKGRELVETHYRGRHPGGVPGRCYCLQFADQVNILEDYTEGFAGPADLATYLTKHPAKSSRRENNRRLFILEDLEPNYIDVLGHHLGVDPLVFSEQMNTWNFTDSNSIPYRGLPSMSTPEQSFSLRYYEIRTLDDPKSVGPLTLQMTFAVNRRRYERWRDIDLPLSGTKDKRHAFIRRCTSFWTSQDLETKDQGWDAVLLVDPGMSYVNAGPSTTYILKDPKTYNDRDDLWNSHDWNSEQHVERKEHRSFTYHGGCSTLATHLLISQVSEQSEPAKANLQAQRDLTSPLDEQVFYWTKIASKSLIQKTNEQSSNTTYYALKNIAQHWTNQLELINCTIAKAEYISDDYQATIDNDLSQEQWKADLIQISQITKDINYMRRHMNHFWRAMVLNLERLSIQLGCEQIDPKLSLALQGAQKDLLTIHTRFQLLRARVEALTTIANDLANLQAAFRGVHDSEFSLRLSLFASVVFPLTLVASIFSMNEEYLPGARAFWKFWAISLPFTAIFALVIAYGTRPYRILRDAKKYAVVRHRWRKEQAEIKKSSDGIGKIQSLRRRAKNHSSFC